MQGGTVEWAAAVGVPEDFTRNWAYTALSRGRAPTRLYVATELPAPVRERAAERAEVAPESPPEPGPALERLAKAMRRRDDEPLALERLEAAEPPELPDAPATPADTADLRAELEALEAQLASYPDTLAADLDRARRGRTSAEAELARAGAALAELERPPERSWWRRPAPPDGRAIAIERHNYGQADRDLEAATRRERELAPRVPDRGQWEREHAPARERAAVLREELGARRDRYVERALADPPDELRAALGDRPPDARRRADWDRGARAVAGYRFDHEVSGDGPLGDRPGDRASRADWNAARRELERAQRALGRQRERGREQAGHDLGFG